MIKNQEDMTGDLHESYRVVREAATHEERQRVLGDLALALIGAPKADDLHFFLGYRKALTELKERIETPRPPSYVATELLDLAREAIKK